MKNIIKTMFIFLLCMSLALTSLPAMAVSQEEIDALESQRYQLQQRQDELQIEMDFLENDINSLLEKKSALDEQSALLRQDILLLEQEIELYNYAVAEKQTEVENAHKQKEEHYTLYCERVRAMEENNAWSYILFILNADSFSEMLSRIADVADILSFDVDLREEYLSACDKAEKALVEYEAVLKARKQKMSELETQQEKLNEKIEASARLIAQFEDDAERYKAYWDIVDAELEQVQELIDKKSAELWAQEQAAQSPNPGYSGGVIVSGGYYAWPSYCTYVSSPFGPRTHPIYGQLRPHTGVDIAASYGTAITAAASGIVTLAVLDYGSVGYGTYVAIYHPNGTTTLYAHMSALAVSPGQSVSQGQVIGYVGSTGASTGPHIHFEIRVNGACVDPMQYF